MTTKIHSLRSILKRIFVVLVLASGSLWIAVLGCLAYLGYLGYLDRPNYSSEPFVFEPGQKRFEMDVFHECGHYEIGIGFSSKDGPVGGLGYTRTDRNLPAKADIFLFDERGQMVFLRTDFGGKIKGTSGLNPIRFEAGRTGYLVPGRYAADIHIKQTDIDFSRLDAELYISQSLKFLSCGKEKEKKLMYGILGWYWLIVPSY